MIQTYNRKIVRHGCHLFIVALDNNKTKRNRDSLFSYLSLRKIGCGINYKSVTDMTIFKKKFGWHNKTCKKSKYLGDNTISLPIHPNMNKSHVRYICDLVKNFLCRKFLEGSNIQLIYFELLEYLVLT